MNAFDQMNEAMNEAESTLRAADNVADRLARMLVGRLRKADTWTLQKLKRELQCFNAGTRKWRERK